uniref:Immunity related GTPase cinema n=1 Tax=Sarcophilus harrisii TaxID=9305 RepID=A0A7N4NS43_SARHA
MASKSQAPQTEEESTILMAKEELEALRTAFELGDIPKAASRLRELLGSAESSRLDVGVTGESGAGKSSLINALRGIGAEDPGAARTGVIETTTQPTPYPHPQLPELMLWDLPGAGSPGCPADKYLKQVDFARYNFFLLVSPRRCGAVETRLATEILRQGKKFYFIRTKVDEDLAASRTQRPSGYSESAVLQEIRDHCAERLRAAGVQDPRIFLVSNLSPARYDFPLLVATWERELPAHRRHAGLLSLPDISLQALQKKKDALQEQVLKTALVSGVIQALPVPGLAAAYDDALLIRSLRGYHRSFGLDDDSLARLAEQVGKQAGDLRSVIRSPLATEVSPEAVLRMYAQSSDGAMRVARAGRGHVGPHAVPAPQVPQRHRLGAARLGGSLPATRAVPREGPHGPLRSLHPAQRRALQPRPRKARARPPGPGQALLPGPLQGGRGRGRLPPAQTQHLL